VLVGDKSRPVFSRRPKAGKFNTVSLCSKCPSPKGRDRVDSPDRPKPDQRLDVNARC
jgi:hypothetical protein